MKTLSISEAASDLADVLAQVIAGQEIGIRTGNSVVALRPLTIPFISQLNVDKISPGEALRQIQEDAQLTPDQSARYLEEVRAERLASGERLVT